MGSGKVEEVGISRYDGQTVSSRIFPNSFVGAVPGESSFNDVERTGKEFRKPGNEFRRKIRVEEQFQRETRSRPDCEA